MLWTILSMQILSCFGVRIWPEMHPILWSRLTDTRLTKPGAEVHVLSTFQHRCFELADNGLIFAPQTDLAILNYIANLTIIENGAVNEQFVNNHVNFTKTATDIGYGLRPNHPLEQAAENPAHGGKHGKLTPISFDEYAASCWRIHDRQGIGDVGRACSQIANALHSNMQILTVR